MTITAPPSTSRHVRVRGLRFHLRCWGEPARPWVWLGTGWLDSSATFGPLVAGLLPDYYVVAPDWRGLGHSEWPADGYWFADYVADTEALIDALEAPLPLILLGHSMGAQVLSLYAGLRPERVRALALLDGLMLPDRDAGQAPKRYRNWLNQLQAPRPPRHYESFEVLAERIRRQHPQLDADWALFVAQGWGALDGRGRVRLLADPKHHLGMPSLYRVAESEAIWREIRAPVLFIDAGQSLFSRGLPADEIDRRRLAFARRRRRVLPEAGHMLHWDAPEATAAHLRAFFSEI
jgi:pimeloyl-ACP methyl ester carboxylesterase